MIVFSAIEQIEVSLRSRIVHILAHKYGSHWQDNKAIFSVRQYEDAQGNIKTTDVFADTQKIIKDHYNTKNS
jgi:abortive infection bacteriophage resistance protein